MFLIILVKNAKKSFKSYSKIDGNVHKEREFVTKL